jgi:phosphate-selective porin OprO/OprP
MPVFDSHKLMISSRDGNWSIRFGGRVMLDAFLSDEGVAGGTGGGGGNGAEIRRARFFASGKVAGDWRYKLQLDFASNGVAIKDAYISTKIAGLTAKFGNHHEPMGLNEITSSKYITFMERAQSSDLFTPSRQLGASLAASGSNWGVRGGFFTSGIDNGGKGTTTDWALTGRAHFAPLAEKTEVVHLGVSGSTRGFDDNGGPDLEVRGYHNGTKFFDTGTLTAEGQMTLGTELAVVLGPFSAQGEYFVSTLEGNGAGAADIDFDGGYAFVSYFLTGESRPYNAATGTFGRVKGEGAIELAARYDMMNLDDVGFGTSAAEVTSWTLGANYYFNPYVRAMLNYQNSQFDFTTASGAADADVDFYGTRLQLDF